MFYWNPAQTELQTWQPIGGWNALYSDRDKMQSVALYAHLTGTKHYSEKMATTLVQMMMSKQLYRGLQYSKEQERELQKALQ